MQDQKLRIFEWPRSESIRCAEPTKPKKKRFFAGFLADSANRSSPVKKRHLFIDMPVSNVPTPGLEPGRPCDQQILSLLRLPLRHVGGPPRPERPKPQPLQLRTQFRKRLSSLITLRAELLSVLRDRAGWYAGIPDRTLCSMMIYAQPPPDAWLAFALRRS